MVEAIYLFLSLILTYSCLTLNKCNLVVLSDLQTVDSLHEKTLISVHFPGAVL